MPRLLLLFLLFLETCGGMEEDLHAENVFLTEPNSSQNENDEKLREFPKEIVSQNVGNQINNEGNEQTTGTQSKRIAEKENPNAFCVKIFCTKIPILTVIVQFLSVKEFARSFRGINRNTSLLPIERFLEAAGISDVFREYFRKDAVTPEEFKILCLFLFDTQDAWKLGLAKIKNIPELPPINVPFLLYSFVEQGCRFFPISFSRWMFGMAEHGSRFRYIEVTYQIDNSPIDKGPKWFVKYFEDGSIFAMKRTKISTGPAFWDCSISDKRINLKNVHKLPILNKVFVTKNLLRHSIEQQPQDPLQNLRTDLECKNQ